MKTIFTATVPRATFVVLHTEGKGYHVEQRDTAGCCVNSTIRFEKPGRAMQIAVNWIKHWAENADIDALVEEGEA